jgi:hypothetical protein
MWLEIWGKKRKNEHMNEKKEKCQWWLFVNIKSKWFDKSKV